MVKIVALLKRRSDLSFTEFDEHWNEIHAPLVRALPGLRGYVQNPAHQHPRHDWLYDGVAELWFPSIASVRTAFSSEAACRMRLDEAEFIGDQTWLLADERPIARP